ncbi:LysR family transcriptional regulator [Parvibacter caecicola]|uniref:DNA-binding transcriptional LysR family regulator n=1 Tax=Parvibacter caecicola TaxID=747645 RepID=A0A7W5D378_9ACTN|nr:LysR family transcriptional regulator [Parvibacter caecicola]MBB3171822.1 DNA-binding transcriptional LysR family regulator [Parvibacter caecicola]MCR2040619.1 LysR family transcriptional regulator [Parvibacter caecicola]RNL10800.1 LysR family transcriptional regulator [Parvibacter caecicola]
MQDFRVKTFLAVCKTLNYTRAAEELSLTQPAVSQHIAFLEKEYGAKLFVYQRKKLELTPAGRVLRDALSTMAHDDALLHQHIAEVAHGAKTQLRIGMTLTAGEYVMATPLAAFLAERPQIRAHVRSGDTKRLLGLMADGEIDCAFVEGLFDKTAYAWDTFRTERLVCICAAGRRPAQKVRNFNDLLGERLILREEGSGSRAVLEGALAQRDLSTAAFADTCVVGSLNILKIFVAQGLGISFVYEAAVQRELQEGTLGVIPLPKEHLSHDISFIRLKNSLYEKELRLLYEGLKEAAAANRF